MRIATFLVASVLLAPPATAQTPDSLRQEVQAFVKSYVEAVNSADMTAYAEMYAHREDLIVIDNGQITRGWDALRDETNQMLGREGTYRFSLGTVDVLLLGSRYALATYPFVATVASQQGPVQYKGAMSLLVERTTKGWSIIHDHTSLATGQ